MKTIHELPYSVVFGAILKKESDDEQEKSA